jgi:formylglycine-generating enzyme required for sulfatase activity
MAVNIQTVPVGNTGNAADSTEYGAVNYEYSIGKYEVTNAQYSAFLNAVATVGDPHGLYKTDMNGGWNDIGGISRTGLGTEGDPWAYSPRANRGNRPVNYVSFWDAARFANWLHNTQPTGVQDLTTTEDGAYYLNGVTNPVNASISREGDWKWAVCSEDEWYKAAYYDGGSSVYYDYPTGSNTAPTAEAPLGADMTNGSANYWDGDYLDATYYTTEVGAYTGKPSDSAYGTFDQGGNVWEWNEAIIDGSYRSLRGGSFEFGGYDDGYDLSVNVRSYNEPTTESYNIGFRVSEVPEPATVSFLALGGLSLLQRRKYGMCK